MFVNHLCESKGEQNSQADKTQESFCELVIPSGDAPIALDPFEEVFYPVTTPVERCGKWHSRRAVSASRNAGFNSLGGRCLSEGGAIIAFVADERRIFWQALGQLFCEGNVGFVPTGAGGSSILDLRLRDGKRQSVFRSYTFPYMDRPNLTALTHALVIRITFEGKRATGVECIYSGKTHRISVGHEVVLSLGAIHTPKVLMQFGIGNEVELQRHGIPLVQHLPGVGQNFQDHPAIGSIWEYQKPLAPRNNAGEATFFWKSDPSLDAPDIQTCQCEVPLTSAEMLTRFNPPAGAWTMFGGIVRPKSQGRIRLTGPNPMDPVQIETNMMDHPDDLKAAIACVQLCREIGNSAALRPFTKREAMPGNLKAAELEDFK